jgi:hypothetical protein
MTFIRGIIKPLWQKMKDLSFGIDAVDHVEENFKRWEYIYEEEIAKKKLEK